jgi:hypothetical protein
MEKFVDVISEIIATAAQSHLGILALLSNCAPLRCAA